jgi:NNP family nitrate/nitrite transporter-like MFS transporter
MSAAPARSPRTSHGFRGAGHPPSLVAALLHFDISFLVWVLIGALGAYIAKDLGLSSAQKGLLVAVPPLGGSFFRVVVGSISDRFGLKATGLTTLGLTTIPLVWGWQAAGTFPQLLGIGLLLGLAGASFVVALPLVSRWYPPEHQGLALGIAGAGNSGTLIASLAAPRIAEHVGWHATFGLALLPVALAWTTFLVLAKEPPRPAVAGGGMLGLLRETDARWLCLFYMVSFGGFVGMSGYLPIFFVDRFGLTKVTAASFAALCAAAGSFLRPLGGALSDRRGGTAVLVTILAGGAVLAAGLATLPALAPTVVLLFLLLGSLGIANGAVFQLVPQRFPDRVGAMTGLVGAAGGLGGFAIPFALGSLEGLTGTFAAGFALYGAVAALAMWAMTRRQRAWRAAWNLEVAL